SSSAAGPRRACESAPNDHRGAAFARRRGIVAGALVHASPVSHQLTVWEVSTETAIAEDGARALRFTILLGGMLAELMLVPLFDSATGIRVGQGLGVFGLLAVLSVVGPRRDAVVLFGLVSGLQVLSLWTRVPAFRVASVILRLMFLGSATILIVRYVLRERGVTTDTVLGAACAYVLLGTVWTQIYALLQYARPSAFAIP